MLPGAIWKFTASHREEGRKEGRRERGREREREKGCGHPRTISGVSPVVVFKLARLAENTDDQKFHKTQVTFVTDTCPLLLTRVPSEGGPWAMCAGREEGIAGVGGRKQ